MSVNFDTLILRTFVAVAQTGSLAKAANVMNRSQPAISQQLTRLEDVTGCKLFDRGPKGAILTNDGEAFLAYANRILALTDEAVDHFRPRRFEGRVVLGMIEDFAFGFLTDALVDFAKLHTKLEMEVVVSDSASLREGLISGRLDIALGDPFYLEPFSVWKETIDTAWYTAETLDLEKSPVPLVMFSNPCRCREAALDVLNDAGTRWRIVYESSSLQAIYAAAGAGLGIACCMEKAKPPGTRRVEGVAGLPEPPSVEVGLGVRDGKHAEQTTYYLTNLIRKILLS